MKRLASEQEIIGKGVEIHPSAQFINVRKLFIGDYSYIGPDTKIIGGNFAVGDYSKIHNACYIYPKKGITLGHNTWIGQGTHLDGTGGIRAGNFLGVGINSALYSHIRHGDITEGCRFDGDSFLDIGEDVWFVGMCLVSPIIARSKSVALLGSVVTRDMEANHVYGGNPAKDLTEKMGAPWIQNPIEQKIENVEKFIFEFCSKNSALNRERFVVGDSLPTELKADVTYFDLNSRVYTKTGSADEVALCRAMFPYKAKFKPHLDNIPVDYCEALLKN